MEVVVTVPGGTVTPAVRQGGGQQAPCTGQRAPDKSV